jgi:hypothetical protein
VLFRSIEYNYKGEYTIKIKNNLKLGILYKNGKMVNHRSLLKVMLNPILRYFGFCIGTPYNKNENKLCGVICIFKCKRTKKIKWNFNNMNEHDIIIKKRIII